MLKHWIALAFTLITSSAIFAQTAPPAAQQPKAPAQSAADWQRKHDSALKYKSLLDFYNAMKKEAASKPPAPLPDWSGIWTADNYDDFQHCLGGSQCLFTPGPGGVAPKLTPVAMAELKSGKEKTAKGQVYDENLSSCGPAGFPRWLQEPFLREMIVTPKQTYLLTEQMNEIRRVYTDGSDHTPEADRYPLPEGDSIGFWDGQKLVIHTNQLESRPMGRNQPMQSDQMETVEIWERTGADDMTVDLWLFDPRLYQEPWYFRRVYARVSNPKNELRIRYWDCGENPNNDVNKTKDGDTQFGHFGFTEKSKDKPNP